MSYSNNMKSKDIVALDVIYKKKYVFGLRLLKPFEFQSDKGEFFILMK